MSRQSEKPKIDIEMNTFDRFLETTALIALLFLIGLPAYYFHRLPAIIPTHFGMTGVPDNTGPRGVIWFLPVTGLILYAALTVLNKYPHVFNYPAKITTENVRYQYKTATQLIRLLKVLIAAVFVYLTLSSIRTALGKQEGIGNYFVIGFVLLMSMIMSFYLYQIIKDRS